MQQDGGLRLRAEYNTDLFDDHTITRMLGHFQVLVEEVIKNPKRRLSALPMFSEPERAQRVPAKTGEAEVEESCLHHLFELQVSRTPEAVRSSMRRTNADLPRAQPRSNQVANYLMSQRIGPECVVALLTDRTPEMLIGLLGVLKAGGAFVPLDPSLPLDRLAFMLKDSQSKLLLTQRAFRALDFRHR